MLKYQYRGDSLYSESTDQAKRLVRFFIIGGIYTRGIGMGYWKTYKANLRTSLPLARRDYIAGLIVPVMLTLYLWAIGDGVLARPGGIVVEWWIQFVSENFSVVTRTKLSLTDLGASKQIQDFSTFAFSVFVFGMFLNLIVQFSISFCVKADELVVRSFVDNIRENRRLDPRVYLTLVLIFFATMNYLILVEIGFDPAPLRQRRILDEFYFISNFLAGLVLQYVLGNFIIISVVLGRKKLI
jgi:hypothetical protein